MKPLLRLGTMLAVIAALPACDWIKKEPPAQKGEKQLAAEQRERIRKACASEGTYDRLKELIFDEAARIRKADPRRLDPLAAVAVVRMEEPLVKSRDEALNVTVCTGRFILELPPGAENAFDGERRLSAEVEYAAQAALDGSGLVYQMDGAEPIVYRLAAIGLPGQPMPKLAPVAQPDRPAVPPPDVVSVPAPAAPAARAPEPAPRPTRITVRPSFNCLYAKTATEKMVCASPALAAQDREMASLYYALMAEAAAGTRSHLRRSRDAFLARREQCGSESCVAAAYRSRMAELRRIAQGG